MTQGDVLVLFCDALFLVVVGVAVLILPSLAVGLVVSVFQAATQINEQTLSFVPKIVATLGTFALLFPWIMATTSGLVFRFETHVAAVEKTAGGVRAVLEGGALIEADQNLPCRYRKAFAHRNFHYIRRHSRS